MLLAFLVELIWGLSLTRGFHHIPVQAMYVMGTTSEKELYLSIDSPPGLVPYKKVRVHIENVVLDVNPSLPHDLVMSSSDLFIWGNRWPWLKQVTLTVKKEKQREGFRALFKPENLVQLRQDYKKGIILGITKYGLLINEGRILQD